ncbi:MAG: leucine--tRNA ligase, partial [Planctomycetota bacterium]|nr:leucine--tRNA ligase [Planctomycetota bacterium]
ASTIRMQEEWIGRSEGADINFSVIQLDSSIRVYTTRPDTLFGVTFMALAPEHPLVEQLVATPPSGCNSEEIAKYVAQAKSRSDVDRMANSKEKTGVNTGLTAMNPATGKDIPIWIADYVLMGYGHGAIMAVPGHDQRDHDFAIVHNIPIVEVIKSSNEKSENDCISGKGTAINSSSDLLAINGLQTDEAIDAVISWLEKNNIGKAKTNYKLRDWLFSRQRYWGEPFPIVFDECGKHYPVPESELPITLPDIDDYTPPETDDPTPLLAKANTWLHTTAGQAGIDPSILESNMPVTREANTMPGWAGSCWYALRFCSPHNDKQLVDKDAEKYWMGDGVDLYIGGAEHAVLHLLYARFWHKFLYDLKEISCDEPFRKLFHQGLLTSFAYQRKNKSLVAADAVEERNGQYVESGTGEKVERIIAKMSKSLRNVVNPDDIIEEYGADTLRLYEMYMGPLEASAPWNTRDIIGVHRFLQRVWRLGIDEDTGELRSVLNNKLNEVVERALHATIAKVSEDIPKLSHNTAIASMIEFVNTATSEGEITKDQLNRFVCILSPFAPHIAQEMYMKISGEGYITQQPWPAFDPKQLLADVVEMPVQIMGKVRGRISVPTGSTDEEVEQIAINDEHIKRLLENLTVEKIVIVQNKIINIVAK